MILRVKWCTISVRHKVPDEGERIVYSGARKEVVYNVPGGRGGFEKDENTAFVLNTRKALKTKKGKIFIVPSVTGREKKKSKKKADCKGQRNRKLIKGKQRLCEGGCP